MTRKIVTNFDYPPIPDRSRDWVAYFDGDDEYGPWGYGSTEAEAIADLHQTVLDDISDEHDADEELTDYIQDHDADD